MHTIAQVTPQYQEQESDNDSNPEIRRAQRELQTFTNSGNL